MQKLSSDITLIRWGYSVVLAIVACLLSFGTGFIFEPVVWVAPMIILITLSVIFQASKVSTIFKVIISILALLIIPISGYAWWAGFLITIGCEVFALRKTWLKGLIALTGSATAYAVFFAKHTVDGPTLLKTLALLSGMVAMYVIASVFAGRMMKTEEEYALALRRSALDSMNERKLREELSYKMAEEEMNARLMERERISRDIHNSVGHTLSAASVTLDAAKILVDSDKDKATEKMTVANDRIKESIEAIRSVVRTLDNRNDTVLVKDYLRSLTELTANFALDTEVKVYHNFDDITDEGGLDISVASFISGAISELLTNGLKHGNANVFVIMMMLDAKHISLKVQDNGRGFGDISIEEERRLLDEGFGLKKIRSHVSSLGGTMETDGSDGFKVMIDLPRVDKDGDTNG